MQKSAFICPECSCDDVIKDSDGIYCTKCGLQLEEGTMYSGGFVSKIDKRQLLNRPAVTVKFLVKEKYEIFAFLLGLKNNKFAKDWVKQMCMPIEFAKLLLTKPLDQEMREQIIFYVRNAMSLHAVELQDSIRRFEQNWSDLALDYFDKVSRVTSFGWGEQEYFCYPSLICSSGFSNSAKRCVILQYRWDKNSNYVLAHELFHIHFHDIITSMFREPFTDVDMDMSEVIVNFVLLDELHYMFPDKTFDLSEAYGLLKHKSLANKLYPSWQNRTDFRSFIAEAYRMIGVSKTLNSWMVTTKD